MQRLATLMWVLLAAANTVVAQTNLIGVYEDVAGTDCNIVDESNNFVTVYVVHSSVEGATASQFSAPEPGCFSGSWLSDTSVFPITVGDSQNGVAINYGSCQTGSFHVLTINYYAPGVTPDCCPYTVLSHDGTLPAIVEVSDCNFNTIAGVGETSQINKTTACDCCLPGTIYVPPYPNIQAAIDAACSGDTIILADDTYVGPGNRDLVISGKALTLKSAGGDPNACVISPQGNEIEEHFGITIERTFGDTMVIEGIGIEKSHHSIWNPITCNGMTTHRVSMVLRNCRINQNSSGMLTHHTDLVVENCVFEDNEQFGLSVGFQSNAAIDDCEFTHNNGDGVQVMGALTASIGRSIIDNNFDDGIHCEVTDSLIVRDTEITESGGNGVKIQESVSLIDSCTISGNAKWGIFGDEVEIELFKTVIATNTLGALAWKLNATGLLSGCTLYGNSGAVLQCASGSAPVEIINTIIASNPATVSVFHCGILSVVCSDIWGNTCGDWVGEFAPFEGINGNISKNPLLCDPDNSDFALSALSDCLPANNTCGVLIGARGQGCDEPIGVYDTQPQIGGVSLYQNHPNPFNPTTMIAFTLPERSRARLSVYNIEGKLVTTLVDETLNAGFKEITWHGKDARGNQVSTGLYFYRLTAGNRTLTKKMVLVR